MTRAQHSGNRVNRELWQGWLGEKPSLSWSEQTGAHLCAQLWEALPPAGYLMSYRWYRDPTMVAVIWGHLCQ